MSWVLPAGAGEVKRTNHIFPAGGHLSCESPEAGVTTTALVGAAIAVAVVVGAVTFFIGQNSASHVTVTSTSTTTVGAGSTVTVSTTFSTTKTVMIGVVDADGDGD